MWRTININKSNIKKDTGRATLIACPHKSDYDGYCFWHPSKLVREGRHSGAVSISYTEDFTFTLRKVDKHYNVIDEVELNYEEIEEVFGVMNEHITAPKKHNDFETHKPRALIAELTDADESLIDNE